MLHHTINAIRAQTWEAINRNLLSEALKEKVEGGERIRVDSTATAALMHAPSDSSLLYDAVRVMARLLESAEELASDADIEWRDHRPGAKRRAYMIQYTRGRPNRIQHYGVLIKFAKSTRDYVGTALIKLQGVQDVMVELWRGDVDEYRPLISKIISQAERRVLLGETVPASEKIVSLFRTARRHHHQGGPGRSVWS